jgi:hypothetical protein
MMAAELVMSVVVAKCKPGPYREMLPLAFLLLMVVGMAVKEQVLYGRMHKLFGF